MNRESTAYSIISHLRFPFSFLLLPVFLFAVSQVKFEEFTDVVVLFFVWHVLVYPSSNAYNSTQDRDEGPIGGLKNPPKVPKALALVALGFDVLAILIGYLIFGLTVGLLILGYIVVSRLYSNRTVRLKKYPWLSVCIIFVFQGSWVYATTSYALDSRWVLREGFWALLAAGFQVAAIYPISQIFQHESDRKDGVKSLSISLGYEGTFLFTAALYSIGLVCYFLFWQHSFDVFLKLLAVQIPILFYFTWWFLKVKQKKENANFSNTMRFTLLSSLLMNAFFIYLILTN